jgi:hypothetical protein
VTESIKASEPLTSAAVAMSYGVDALTKSEGLGLLSICLGVYMISSGGTAGGGTAGGATTTTMAHSTTATVLVLMSNLCFSLRATFQKKINPSTGNGNGNGNGSTSNGQGSVIDPTTLQFRFSYFGLYLTLPLFLVYQILSFSVKDATDVTDAADATTSPVATFYKSTLPLLIINTLTFTTYNLSSTTVLSRLRPIQHAILNCARRLFQIVVTALCFYEDDHFLNDRRSLVGLLFTFCGFGLYTYVNFSKKMSEERRKEKNEESIIFDPV